MADLRPSGQDAQAVADAAHRFVPLDREGVVDARTRPAHVDAGDVGGGVENVAPDGGRELLAGVSILAQPEGRAPRRTSS
jgi:hypothetical protein